MTRTYRSAGAIVVSSDPTNPLTLLLEQIRSNGEHQVVAPKGTIETGESPLTTAAREVREETGLADLLYVGFLGQQRYTFTDRDNSPAAKTVDWFLFATDITQASPRVEEGFVAARWLRLTDAAQAASHAGFGPYLEHAQNIVTWHQPSRLRYSQTLSDLIWHLTAEASAILAHHPDGGIGICGSAARGDFVTGWSDVDLIGWGIQPDSPTATRLNELVANAGHESRTHISLRLATPDGHDASGAGAIADMKLRSVLRRSAIDTPVIAGTNPPEMPSSEADDLASNIDALRDFAVRQLAVTATSDAERVDRARRTLSVLCSGARLTALSIRPNTNLRLPVVIALLDQHRPGTIVSTVLADYDRLRRCGHVDLRDAEALAEQVPAALGTLRQHASRNPAQRAADDR